MSQNWFIRSLVRLILAAEQGFVVVALLLLMDAFGLQLASKTVKLIYNIIYVITFCLLMVRWQRVIPVIKKGGIQLLLVGIAILSILWSVDPRGTNIALRDFVGITAFAVYLASRYTLQEQLRLLSWTFGIATVLSLFYGVAMPGIGTDPKYEGAWRGIYKHKNLLGRMMTLSAVIHWIVARSSVRYAWISYALCGLSFVLMRLTTSAGGLLITLNLLFLIPVYKMLRFRSRVLAFLIVFGGLLATVCTNLLADNLASIFNALGKDMTLTGRTPLWTMLFGLLHERRWFGFGYQAFWRGWQGPSEYVWRYTTWNPPHAHNGFIDLMLDMGWLGLFVFGLGFLVSISRGIVWIRTLKSEEALWPMLFITFLFVANLPESCLIRAKSGGFWILYLAASLLIPNSSEPANQTDRPTPTQSTEETMRFPKRLRAYRQKKLRY